MDMRKIENRLNLFLRQGKVRSTDDDQPVQIVQVDFPGETDATCQRPQQYGISSHVVAERSRALVLTAGGLKFVVGMDDPDNRPQGLAEGDVCVYSHADTGDDGPHRILFKADGREIHHLVGDDCAIVHTPDEIRLSKDKSEVLIDADGVAAEADEITATARKSLKAEAPEIEATATKEIKMKAPRVVLDTLRLEIPKGDVIATGVSLLTHVHAGVTSGPATSGPPVPIDITGGA